MPYRTGRHNRRQLIYRLPADLPADTPPQDERWTLALVVTDPELSPRDVIDALNAAEAHVESPGHLPGTVDLAPDARVEYRDVDDVWRPASIQDVRPAGTVFGGSAVYLVHVDGWRGLLHVSDTTRLRHPAAPPTESPDIASS